MDAAVEKEIVRRYFSKARQDRALYALQSSKRHSYIWKLDESFFRRTGRQEFSPGSDIRSELKRQGVRQVVLCDFNRRIHRRGLRSR